jgi:hypothetical protein
MRVSPLEESCSAKATSYPKKQLRGCAMRASDMKGTRINRNTSRFDTGQKNAYGAYKENVSDSSPANVRSDTL